MRENTWNGGLRLPWAGLPNRYHLYIYIATLFAVSPAYACSQSALSSQNVHAKKGLISTPTLHRALLGFCLALINGATQTKYPSLNISLYGKSLPLMIITRSMSCATTPLLHATPELPTLLIATTSKLTVRMLMCYQYVYPDMHSSNWLRNGSSYKIFNVESA